MPTAPNPTTDRPALLAALTAFQERLQQAGTRRSDVLAGVSGWAVDQHAYHAALAASLALQNVTNLVAEKGVLIRLEAEPSALFPKLVELGFPRGQTKSPRMVVPPDAVDPEILTQELTGAITATLELETILGRISDAPGFIPHQLLGALTAEQWLGFARMHTEHHLMIATEIAGAL
tara:strand:- start:1055 stop:1585 length:531 start_codon:yes stop_codon:yes gene_type:complete